LEKFPFFTANSFIIFVLILYVTLSVNGECVNLPPSADFTHSPIFPYTRETITFNASASYDPDGFIFSYTWDFGDENITTVSTPIIIHYYNASGNYYVNLTVRDNLGLNNSVVKTISVLPRVVASFSYWPPNPLVCKPVTFNASDSKPEEGYIVSYSWDFGDGNITVISEPLITHHFLAEGLYVVELNVTDSMGGWNTMSQILNVSKPPTAPPIAVFTWAPLTAEAGEPVTFDASDSTPNGGEIVLYVWDFGDETSGNTSHPKIAHIYQSFGNYTVVLNVTDSEGETASVINVIRVVERPKADFFFIPTEPRVCTKVTFDGSISDPRGGYIVEYKWNFGDGSPDVYGIVVIHRFPKMGEYNISLNVTDSEGKWDLKSITLRILPHKADLNEDGVVNIIDMSIFARAFGSYPGHERWNPKVDLNSDEKVNILDGVIIARSFNQCIDLLDP